MYILIAGLGVLIRFELNGNLTDSTEAGDIHLSYKPFAGQPLHQTPAAVPVFHLPDLQAAAHPRPSPSRQLILILFQNFFVEFFDVFALPVVDLKYASHWGQRKTGSRITLVWK